MRSVTAASTCLSPRGRGQIIQVDSHAPTENLKDFSGKLGVACECHVDCADVREIIGGGRPETAIRGFHNAPRPKRSGGGPGQGQKVGARVSARVGSSGGSTRDPTRKSRRSLALRGRPSREQGVARDPILTGPLRVTLTAGAACMLWGELPRNHTRRRRIRHFRSENFHITRRN